MSVNADDVRAITMSLPRTTEGLVRDSEAAPGGRGRSRGDGGGELGVAREQSEQG